MYCVGDSCGDAQGEHDFKELSSEVGDLKDTVETQSKELQVVEVRGPPWLCHISG